jgi:phage terminase small subunit
MPFKGGRMTPRERLFAKAYAVTGDAATAGKKAGYESEAGLYGALHRPAVLEEIAKHQDELMRGDLLPKAVSALNVMLTDERTPYNVRFQAAKFTIEYSKAQGDGVTKEAHEMTAEELAQAIAQLKATTAAYEIAKADRARPVIDGDLFG